MNESRHAHDWVMSHIPIIGAWYSCICQRCSEVNTRSCQSSTREHVPWLVIHVPWLMQWVICTCICQRYSKINGKHIAFVFRISQDLPAACLLFLRFFFFVYVHLCVVVGDILWGKCALAPKFYLWISQVVNVPWLVIHVPWPVRCVGEIFRGKRALAPKFCLWISQVDNVPWLVIHVPWLIQWVFLTCICERHSETNARSRQIFMCE